MAPKSQPTAASSSNGTTDSPSLPSAVSHTSAAAAAAATTGDSSSKDGSQAPTPSRQSRNPSPTSTKPEPEAMAPTNGKGASTSQPMNKSSSSSSSSLSNQPDAAKDAAGTGPSPYGTRSRNRTGRARPNYAEDKDVDMMDYEMQYPERNGNSDSDVKKVQQHEQQPQPQSQSQAQSQPPPPPQQKQQNQQQAAQRQSYSSSSGSKDAVPRPAASSTRKPLPNMDSSKSSASIREQSQAAQNSTNNASSASTPSSSSAATGAAAAAAAAATAPLAQPASKKRKAGAQSSSGTPKETQASAAAHKSAPSNNVARKILGRTVGYPETNLMSFDDTKARPKDNKLTADDGTVLAVNDHVYLVCEPPGEPYYIGRIMEFLHKNNDASGPVDSIRVNWFYRPKDMLRKTQDTRQLFATMHSDISPLNTLRGKCTVKHKADIAKPDEYRKMPDCFWWDKLYDRYISKNYDAIPTSQIINVPERVKKVLDERWKFILVEQGRGKELTSAVKSCRRCNGYCASADSVDCGFCGNTYHMTCVRPPLQKKPARGFGWACAPCNLAQERKLEALNAPHLHHAHAAHEDEEVPEEEDDDPAHVDTCRTSPSDEDEHPPPTAEQLHQASLWPYRYLGMHCKIEDALDYDDRIYPRASSRLGPRHQATVNPWPGQPIEFVKPLDIKRSGRKDGRQSKEIQALIEKDKRERELRPKHIQDEPFPGYIPRGLDLPEDDPNCTAQAMWKPPWDKEGNPLKDAHGKALVDEAGIDAYMDKARSLFKTLAVPQHSTNLEDKAIELFYKANYNAEKALQALRALPKADFKEPDLSSAEQKRFEEAAGKFGSEMGLIKRFVKTVPHGMITRHWYKWKKTPKGKQIWGNYSQRKGKKEIKKAQAEASKVADEVADDADDSAFDTEKARSKKKNLICKFCNTKSSRQWRRAPNVTAAVLTETGSKSKDKGTQYIVALCRRCAELWRRYAIQWEDVDEMAKKVASAGGRGWKKKVDEELLKELQTNNEMIALTNYSTPEPSTTVSSPAPTGNGTRTASQELQQPQPQPRKKLKTERDSEPAASSDAPSAVSITTNKKKDKDKEKKEEKEKEKDKNKDKAAEKALDKEKEKTVVDKPAEKPAPPPPPPPVVHKARIMPCDVCGQLEPLEDQHLHCKECRLAVHRNCYGVVDNRNFGKWSCDTCTNDKNPQASFSIKCVLCPIEKTEHDFVEPPKISHKKKTEKERDRERQEKERAVKTAEYFRQRQEDLGRPVNPREPLKRTADNNWVHVTCAVFTPEVKFGNAKALEPSEGIPSIPRNRYDSTCKVCKTANGACVSCHHCKAQVHVGCAHQAGYTLGFDIAPVKGSRRDQHNIVSIGGESGTMTAAIWCKEHPPKTPIHRMHDLVDESGLNALQLYVRNYKQADLTLTGCARKANLLPSTTRPSTAIVAASPVNRRASTTTIPPIPMVAPAQVNGFIKKEELPVIKQPTGKICFTCGTDISPKWYPIDEAQGKALVNGFFGSLGSEAQKFVAQRTHQCHKCKKANRQAPSVMVKEEETSPAPPPPLMEASQSSSSAQAVQAVQAASSPQNLMSVGRIAPQPWDNAPRRPSLEAPMMHPPSMVPPVLGLPIGPHSLAAVPPMAAPMVQGPPPAAPPSQQPLGAPSISPSVARGPPSISQYAPPPPPSQPTQNPPYREWRRPSSQHSTHQAPPPPPPPSHIMNGGHPHLPPNSMPPLAPPNHLRPPPLASIPPPPPPLQNGHGHVHAHNHGHHSGPPPMVNGMPPSPRGHGVPSPQLPMSNGGPYMPAGYHHATHAPPAHAVPHAAPPPHHLTNGGPPPRAPEHPFGGVLLPARSPYGSSIAVDLTRGGRDTGNPPTRPPEPPRQASGASASPSLRNLLH